AGTSTIDTAGGVLNVLDADGTGVDGIATAGNALTLDGGATGVITVSTLSGGGALTLTDSGSTTFSGAVTAGATTLTDTTGTVSFEGDTTLASLVTTTAGYGLSFTGASNTVGGATVLQNTGALVLGNEATDSIEFTGGLDARGTAGVDSPLTTSLAGTVATQGGTGILLNDATLTAATTLDSTSAGAAAGGAVVTTGTLTGGSNTLTIDAGTAGVVTTSAFSGVDSFTLLDAASATFAAASDATMVDLNLTTGGAITFNGLLTATTLTTDADDTGVAGDASFDLALNAGAAITNDTNFDNSGALTLGAAGLTSSFAGGLSTTGVGGTVTLNGTVASSNTQMDLGAITLGSDVTLDTAGATMNVGAVSSAANRLALDGGETGAVTVASFAGDGDLTVTDSATTTFTGTVAADAITLTDSTTSVSFADTVTASSLATAAQGYSVSLTGA
ncbi:MAG: hypothetical protein VX072_04880, partial [Pseudomonadota bacterium]|nr:hypothetical protein [Pseudomonadota bacterium]